MSFKSGSRAAASISYHGTTDASTCRRAAISPGDADHPLHRIAAALVADGAQVEGKRPGNRPSTPSRLTHRELSAEIGDALPGTRPLREAVHRDGRAELRRLSATHVQADMHQDAT